MLGLMQDWPLLCHRIIDHAWAFLRMVYRNTSAFADWMQQPSSRTGPIGSGRIGALWDGRYPFIARRILRLPVPGALWAIFVPGLGIEISQLFILHLIHFGVELGPDSVGICVIAGAIVDTGRPIERRYGRFRLGRFGC